MVRAVLVTLVALLVLVVAACGGSEKTAASAAGEVAGLVPADVPLVLAIETDPESDQWQQAEELLSRFPGRQRLYDGIRDSLSEEDLDLEQDVLPAFGDETYLVVLDFEEGGDNVVALTKPRDPDKLAALIAQSEDKPLTREADGWTLIAETEAAFDRLTAEGEKLEDADWFAAAQERVEEDALVTFFANGPAIEEAVRTSLPEGCDPPENAAKVDFAAGVLRVEDDGVRVRAAAGGEGLGSLAEGESLLAHVPAQAFAYLGGRSFAAAQLQFGDQLRCGAAAGADLGQVERMLGVSFDDIGALLAGGFAFYVRSAPVIPELTLVLSPEDQAKALQTLETLAERAAPLLGSKVQTRTIDGVPANEIRSGPVTVAWGGRDGRIVVTTQSAGFDALSEAGDSLEDDDGFQDALEAAGVEDAEDVVTYLDLRSLIDLFRTLSGFSGTGIPPEVEANLEPLRSLVGWAELSDEDAEFGVFVGIG